METAKIKDLNVTAGKLAADAVETAKIKDLNVTAGKLAADAVETAKIKDLNVTAGKLAADAVETAKIKDGAVTAAKIADASVSAAKIDPSGLFLPDTIEIRNASDPTKKAVFSAENITAGQTRAIAIPNASGTMALTSQTAKAWASINGKPITGCTYSQTGTTITVSKVAHGLLAGMIVEMDFLTGTATDGAFTIATADSGQFTITDTVSRSTSGNATISTVIEAGTGISRVEKLDTGNYALNFSPAFSTAKYCVVGTSRDSDNSGSGGSMSPFLGAAKTAGRYVFSTFAGGTEADSSEINVVCFGV